MQACREAEPQDLPQYRAVEADAAQLNPPALAGAGQLEQAQPGADELGENGGHGGTAYSGVKYADKQQVQHQIDSGGGHEIVEGVTAVPHRLQNAHQNVIHDGTGRPGKVNPQIGHRVCHDLRRGIHPDQNMR